MADQAIDHLVYASPDLDESIRELRDLLGVTAAVGGQHPRWRTRNALLSLGPRVYLEIMAPDSSLPDPARPRPFGIDQLDRPRLATWVAHSADLQKIASIAENEGIDLGEIQAGSRVRPDGSLLRWSMTDLTTEREGGVIPYFIDWGDSIHPAETAPKGCTLEGVKIFHPDAKRITRILSKLGIELSVEPGPALLEAFLATPKGRIVLHGGSTAHG